MTKRQERGRELFLSGYNCAQSVLIPFADVLGLTEEQKPEILMVGDRKFDVLGAKECGIDCAGVEFFGYAEPGELAAAGAIAVVRTAEELDAALRRL